MAARKGKTVRVPGLRPADARTLQVSDPPTAPGVTKGKGAPRKTQRVKRKVEKVAPPKDPDADDIEYLVTEFRRLLNQVKARRRDR